MARAVRALRTLKSPGRCEPELDGPTGEDRGHRRMSVVPGAQPGRPVVGRVGQAHRRHLELTRRAQPVDQLSAARVVDVDDRAPGPSRGEQRRLGGEVGLLVAVEVEVVATEVGEGRHVEGDGVGATQHQGVRRHLHQHRIGALLVQVAEQGLELGRLRRGHRGPGGGQRGTVQAVADGADQAGVVAEGLQCRLEQVGRGRLAVGAGDREHRHRLRRPTVDLGGQARHHRPGVVARDHRYAGRTRPPAPGRIGQDGDRSSRDRGGRELRTVVPGPGQGDVEVAGRHQSRVQGDPGHLGGPGGRSEELVQRDGDPAGRSDRLGALRTAGAASGEVMVHHSMGSGAGFFGFGGTE